MGLWFLSYFYTAKNQFCVFYNINKIMVTMTRKGDLIETIILDFKNKAHKMPEANRKRNLH